MVFLYSVWLPLRKGIYVCIYTCVYIISVQEFCSGKRMPGECDKFKLLGPN